MWTINTCLTSFLYCHSIDPSATDWRWFTTSDSTFKSFFSLRIFPYFSLFMTNKNPSAGEEVLSFNIHKRKQQHIFRVH